ncbi:hypothetical protein HNY73_002786 [Argiope bruennichi]|uniref:Peptidase aspartic putative domain-containing protein n=1 Tax=Argiope bruennichi TaxID=94029 RepID=A0A8T0FUT4_ARGBR|nr:hypothetical protein HNY73_002786 [Argiope bruennichi]
MSNCPRKDTVRCTKCKKKHHISICPPAENNKQVITNSNVNHINIPKSIFTHLQTARLYVTSPKGITKLIRCILDGGSQASFVDTNLIKTLTFKAMSSATLNVQAFESTTTREQCRCVQLSLSSLWSKKTVSITTFERSNTYTTHPTAPTEVVHFARKRRLKLADPPDDSSLPIELLVGGVSAATRELAANHQKEFPIAARMIDKNMYMDYFFASVEYESWITIIYYEIENLMTPVKLPMDKWDTNTLKLKHSLRTHEKPHRTDTTILDIDWNTINYTLGNGFKTSFCISRYKPLAKRWLLRCNAGFYYPFGLNSPFTIFGKITFQDTWIFRIKWDEILPVNLSTLWYAAVQKLNDIYSLWIPRSLNISSRIPYTIHVFCDASQRAYGAILYIVTLQDDKPKVHLVCSRNKLTPIKRVTLPRLEHFWLH